MFNNSKITPQQLAEFRKQLGLAGSDSTALGHALTGDDSQTDRARGDMQHDPIANPNTKNFDQKIYLFPESYNALRRELYENWPVLWASVQYQMAYRAEEFMEKMNHFCDLKLVLDSDKVGWICDQYLTALRKKRGLSQ